MEIQSRNTGSKFLPHSPTPQETVNDHAAYVGLWVLFGVASLIFILISLKIWIQSKQKHENGCPCSKCNRRFRRKANEDVNLLRPTYSSSSANPPPQLQPIELTLNHESKENIKKTRPEIDEFLDQNESSQSNPKIQKQEKEVYAEVSLPLKELILEEFLQQIMEELQKIEIEVDNFSFKYKTHNEYQILHGKLNKNLMNLDFVDSEWEENKASRKECILLIKKLISALEDKLEETMPVTNEI